MDYRGHFGTILPQAQALINAAHLRGDLEAVALAQHQAEWIIGRNPFSQEHDVRRRFTTFLRCTRPSRAT